MRTTLFIALSTMCLVFSACNLITNSTSSLYVPEAAEKAWKQCYPDLKITSKGHHLSCKFDDTLYCLSNSSKGLERTLTFDHDGKLVGRTIGETISDAMLPPLVYDSIRARHLNNEILEMRWIAESDSVFYEVEVELKEEPDPNYKGKLQRHSTIYQYSPQGVLLSYSDVVVSE